MISNTKVLINRIRIYFKKKNNISKDSNYYLTTFDTSEGYLKLLDLQKKKINFIEKYRIKFKNFISSINSLNFEIINANNINNYNQLIVTWGWSQNFDAEGNFLDKYFNENSKSLKNTLWFVISLDNEKPKNIKKNIILLINKKENLIKYKQLVVNLIKNFFLPTSSESLASIVWLSLSKFVNFKKIKKVITPYEAQLFQNHLFNELHIHYKKIQTIGYVHATQAFPVHLFRRNGAPKKLLVHGKDQKFHLIKYFGWNKKNVKLISSIKIRKKNKKNYQNIIYLPYLIENASFYLKNLDYLFENEHKKFSTKLKVKIHPFRLHKKSHLELKKKIELLIMKKKFNKKIKYCNPIILGTSSIILEIIENNLKPYQIVQNMVLEGYSNGLWPSIKKNIIRHESIFQFSLIKKNNCINIDSKKINLFK